MASEAPSIPRKDENPILKLVPSTSVSLWWRQSRKHFWKIPVLCSHVCPLWQSTRGGSHQGHSEGVCRKVEPLGAPVALIAPTLCQGFSGFSWLPSWIEHSVQVSLASLACHFVVSILSCYIMCRRVNHIITRNLALSKNDALLSVV